ncbi:M23 family metallopeptidase [Allokutzneria sp. A3M-2-11 16]|uniref:murein hydrolase activator EnvC family protein n=1 Tax=Allokutzneria sp. A3M-2-11 16 TaxID=2962043 RepID=UPI0020B65E36|nr:M23 family metallopeptidase [Allokutzneria sp. A3M-2-11 16]MCP3797945.1 M23 family metallopeptidase [Allokutzneria sp. A3M-2-11 16]
MSPHLTPLLLAAFLLLPAATPTLLSPPVRTVVSPSSRFGWPLAGTPVVVRHFERPPHRYGPGHRGADLAGTPEQPVLAAGDGTVAFAGQVAGHGVVSIDHPNGLRTTYEPLTPAVTTGSGIARGAVIGALQPGHAGCRGPPACLHWGVRRGEDYLDPLRLLRRPALRLLPWNGDRGQR